ncbi:MAG: type III pantothenate kinase [Phycisphaerales bacterium]
MPEQGTEHPSIPPLVAVAVGNTRARHGVFRDGTLESTEVHTHDNVEDAAAAVRAAASAILEDAGPDPVIVIGSVAPEKARALADAIKPGTPGVDLFHIGSDVQIDITTSLDDAGIRTVGQDRLLNALAGFELTQQACVIVDAGTAITVDFVDGEGVYHGGAIAPGVAMMLASLHEKTEQLPEVKFDPPPAERAWGSNTPDAMNLGVMGAACGLVRWMVERDAERYGAFPLVIATGGDAALLENEGIVDRFVPELQLHGIHAAFRAALQDHEA